ncbi:MAG: hypothetical protein LBK68_04685 [Candidatus Margulisbacteria bacterium]|jgi:hypothetical protein|nr:hypothetical protein [Candidatus Margulisiibacteriota bacterium]
MYCKYIAIEQKIQELYLKKAEVQILSEQEGLEPELKAQLSSMQNQLDLTISQLRKQLCPIIRKYRNSTLIRLWNNEEVLMSNYSLSYYDKDKRLLEAGWLIKPVEIEIQPGQKVWLEEYLKFHPNGSFAEVKLKEPIPFEYEQGQKISVKDRICWNVQGKVSELTIENGSISFQLPNGKTVEVTHFKLNDAGQVIEVVLAQPVQLTLANGINVSVDGKVVFNDAGQIIEATLIQPTKLTLPNGINASVNGKVVFNDAGQIIEATLDQPIQLILANGVNALVSGKVIFNDAGQVISAKLEQEITIITTPAGVTATANSGPIIFDKDTGELSYAQYNKIQLPSGEIVEVDSEPEFYANGQIRQIHVTHQDLPLPDGTLTEVWGTVFFNEAGQIIGINQDTATGVKIKLPAGLGYAKLAEVRFNDAGKVIYAHWGIMPRHGQIYKKIILPDKSTIQVETIRFTDAGNIIMAEYPDGITQYKPTKAEQTEKQKVNALKRAKKKEKILAKEKREDEKETLYNYAIEINLIKYRGYNIWIEELSNGNSITHYGKFLTDEVFSLIYDDIYQDYDLTSKKLVLSALKRQLDAQHPPKEKHPQRKNRRPKNKE